MTGKSDVIVVGCDDGHAEIKLAWMEGGKIKTLAIPSKAQSGSLGLTTAMGGRVHVYETGGQNYTVHPSVQDPMNTRMPEYYASGLNRALVHHALVMANFGGKKVHLVTGLPPGDYFDANDADGVNRKNIERKEASLLEPITERSGKPLAQIVKHTVLSEAVTAVYDFVLGADGQETKEKIGGRVGVVDVGGRTSDVVTVVWPQREGESFYIDQSATASFEIGVLELADRLVSKVRSKHRLDDLRTLDLREVLSKKSVTIFGETVDVSDLIDEARNEVCDRVLQNVRTKIGNGASYSKILLVGGGAYALHPIVAAYAKNGAVPDEPQFANARGMLKAALYVE